MKDMFVLVSVQSRFKQAGKVGKLVLALLLALLAIHLLCWLGEYTRPAPQSPDPIKEKPMRVELCVPVQNEYNKS